MSRTETNFNLAIRRLKEQDPTLTEINLLDKGIGDEGASKLAEALKGGSTVTKLTLWSNDIGCKGGKALAEAMRNNTTLTELYLENNYISDEGGKALAEVLRNNSTLTTLGLSNNYMKDEGGEALAEALRNNSTLTELYLENNYISDEGGNALAEALHDNSTLTELYLLGNSIDANFMRQINRLIEINKESPTPQEAARRKEAEFGPPAKGALPSIEKSLDRAIRRLKEKDPTLTEIYLRDERIGYGGAVKLAKALKGNSTVTKLLLNNDNIGGKGGKALAEAMRINSTLTELNLENNYISDEGGWALAEALLGNSTLTELYLLGNSIDANLIRQINRLIEINKESPTLQENGRRKEAELSVIEALRRKKKDGAAIVLPMSEEVDAESQTQKKVQREANRSPVVAMSSTETNFNLAIRRLKEQDPTLTEINLLDKGIGDEEASKLAESLKGDSTVTKLRLEMNSIGDEGGKELAEALRINSTIAELNLSANSIGAEGGEALAEALRINSTLALLHLYNNIIGNEGGKALAEALHDNSTITLLDLQNNSIGDEGGKALAEALRNNSTLTLLGLGENSIGDKGGKALAEALHNNSTLIGLTLRNNSIGVEGGEALAEALRENSTLTELYLLGNSIGANLMRQINRLIEINKESASPQENGRRKEAEFGPSVIGALRRKEKDEGAVVLPMSKEVGAKSQAQEKGQTETKRSPVVAMPSTETSFNRAIQRLKEQDPTLTEINLLDEGIGDEEASKLAEALKGNSTVTKLHFEINSIGDEGGKSLAEALRINSTITELNLSANNIGAEGGKALAEALCINSTLTLLHLYNNIIGDEGGKALADALHDNSTITLLDLRNNSIGDEGGKALAVALQESSSLTRLDLSRNNIGAEGGKAFAGALHNNSTLTELWLTKNSFGVEGGKALAEALHENSTLKTLYLRNNSIGAEGGKALAEALHNNSTVTRLTLDGNGIGDEGGKAFAEALWDNSTLTELDLSWNSIGDEGGKAIVEALRDNSNLSKLNLDGNKIGDELSKKIRSLVEINEKISSDELLGRIAADLSEMGSSPLLDSLLEKTNNDKAAARLEQLCTQSEIIRVSVKRIRRRVLAEEMTAAARMGHCPWRRGRVAIVGRGRAGKTSLLSSLRGEVHDCHRTSTIGIEVSDSLVRDIGVDINHVAVEAEGKPWKVVAERGSSARVDAVQAEARRRVREGHASSGSSNSSDIPRSAVFDLLQKYGLGRDLGDIEDEFNPEKEMHASTSAIRNQNRDSTVAGNVPKSSDNNMEHIQEQAVTHVAHPMTFIPGASSGADLRLIEDDVAKKRDMEVDDGTGDKLRLSVWDYGGQVVFRNIQHLYMPRNCCYVVVFRVIDILDEGKRGEAIADLLFWLKSVDTYATCHDSQLCGHESESQARSLRYAPLLLVATHFDYIKTDADCNKKLRIINDFLLQTLHTIQSFQANKEDRIKGREFLYNTGQNLCFWPVDNTYIADGNIQRLRRSILRAITEDDVAYLEDPIPLSWLDVVDALSDISEDEPLLPVYSKDPTKPSVIGLMRKAGALTDIEADGNESEAVAAEKRRAVALLQFLHQIGVVVYFDNVPSLHHYCILDPQWLIDTITYVVRDFKLHRFLRDRSAMRADGGKAWDLFLESGILEEKLLNHLWLGEGGYRNFLLRLMMKIGLFALLPKASEDEENQFFVPCSLSLVGATPFLLPNLSSHLAISTNNDAFSFKFAFGSFLPTGMFERVLVRLVNDYWPRGMTERIPQMLPNAAHLLMASGKHAVTLIVSFVTNTIEVFVSNKQEAALVLPHIKGAIRAINEEMYHGRLKIHSDVSDVLHANEMQFCKCPVGDLGPLENRLTSVQLEESAQIKELATFFASAKIDTDDAQKYARSIAMCDPEADVDMLKDMFDALKDKDPVKSMHAASKSFREEVLKDEYGISKCYVQIKIVIALEKCPPPREEKQYLLGFFDVRNLDRAQKEKEKIRSSLARSKLKMADYDMGPLGEIFDKTRCNDNMVLHLAMHGEAKSATGKPTLAFLEDGMHPEADLLAETIASGCLREDGKQRGSIECVFVNGCKGGEIAKLLRIQHAVPFVVFWETAVNNSAAEAFAEEFYRTLCEDKNSFRNFDNAFERAKLSLMQRRWIVDGKGGDPGAPRELLLKRQLDENDLRLEAAGIPQMYGPSDDYLLRMGGRRTGSSSRGRHDELVILQAAPLVCRDNHDEIRPLDALVDDAECRALKKMESKKEPESRPSISPEQRLAAKMEWSNPNPAQDRASADGSASSRNGPTRTPSQRLREKMGWHKNDEAAVVLPMSEEVVKLRIDDDAECRAHKKIESKKEPESRPAISPEQRLAAKMEWSNPNLTQDRASADDSASSENKPVRTPSQRLKEKMGWHLSNNPTGEKAVPPDSSKNGELEEGMLGETNDVETLQKEIAQLRANLERETECQICCEEFAIRVRLGPCGHEMCLSCSNKVMECPSCKQCISSRDRIYR